MELARCYYLRYQLCSYSIHYGYNPKYYASVSWQNEKIEKIERDEMVRNAKYPCGVPSKSWNMLWTHLQILE